MASRLTVLFIYFQYDGGQEVQLEPDIHRFCDSGAGPHYQWSVYGEQNELLTTMTSPTLILRYQDMLHLQDERSASLIWTTATNHEGGTTTFTSFEEGITLTTTNLNSSDSQLSGFPENGGIKPFERSDRLRGNDVAKQQPAMLRGGDSHLSSPATLEAPRKSAVSSSTWLQQASYRVFGNPHAPHEESTPLHEQSSFTSTRIPPKPPRSSDTYQFIAVLQVTEQETIVHAEERVTFTVSPIPFS